MMNEVALNLMNSWLEDDNNITDEGLLLISLFTVADVNNGGKTVLELDELVESIIYISALILLALIALHLIRGVLADIKTPSKNFFR